jgi:hypothetical protein
MKYERINRSSQIDISVNTIVEYTAVLQSDRTSAGNRAVAYTNRGMAEQFMI